MNDEATGRAPAVQREGGAGPALGAAPRPMVELTRTESLALLASVSLGRIVFTRHGLPAIRPVNHAVLADHVVILTHDGAALTSAAGGRGVVVAYEADQIDPDTHLGWSVVVTGIARLATDEDEVAGYREILSPWVDREMAHAVLISLEMVTGFRLSAREGERP